MARLACTDHLGNQFESITEMCEHYGITKSAYHCRIALNWSLEKILTTPVKNTHTICKDHLGNKFKSVTDMCEYWGIQIRNYYERQHRNWTLEQTLTTPVETSDKPCTDHLGNKFLSKAAMCRHWNIEISTYTYRVDKYGWSQEKALTTPPIDSQVTDPYGNIFETQKDMCDVYQVNRAIHDNRLREQKSQIEALGIIPVLQSRLKNYVFDNNLTIVEPINHANTSNYTPKYFACLLNGHEVMLTRKRIIEYCMENLPEDKNPMKRL